MKKLFSILFAAVILISGMHFTMATHTCCGELADVKWSFTGEKATCGMEMDGDEANHPDGFSPICCQNKTSTLSVENNYFSASFHLKEKVADSITLYPSPESFRIIPPSYTRAYLSSFSPPGLKDQPKVELAFICVFLI